MQRFFTKTAVGLDISTRSVMLAAMTRKKESLSLIDSGIRPLAPGVVVDGYGVPNVVDRESLSSVVHAVLRDSACRNARRAAVSLPDSLFRVQMVELDELPEGRRDRERLIRWRLEKAAVFNVAGTVLRYQIAPREERGYSVLACVVKHDVVAQIEDILEEQGLETWIAAPASFHVMNLYAPTIADRGIDAYALVWMLESAYAALIVERGGVRFYRYRDIKAAAEGDAARRLVRELDDTLHFYAHMDRGQRSEIGRVFLAGVHPDVGRIAEGLRSATSFDVDVLTLSDELSGLEGVADALTPVIGAGGAL